MTNDEAIAALIALAKARIVTIDGEWGCCHSYEEALANKRERLEWDDPDEDLTIQCTMHDEAVELQDIIAALP